MDVRDDRADRAGRAIVGAVFVVGALVTFGLLRLAIERDGVVVQTDHRVLRWAVEHRSAWMTSIMRTVTVLGDVRVVVLVGAVAVVLLVAAHRRALAVALVVSSAGASLLVNTTKRLVERPRPPEVFRLVYARGWSFPSGHAGQAAAMYLAIAVIAWIVLRETRIRWVVAVTFGILAALIGLSRVYLAVHWLSDVVAGWSLGLAWFLIALGVARSRTPVPTPVPTPVLFGGSHPHVCEPPNRTGGADHEQDRGDDCSDDT